MKKRKNGNRANNKGKLKKINQVSEAKQDDGEKHQEKLKKTHKQKN